jgi:cytochrome c oxidase subunit 3
MSDVTRSMHATGAGAAARVDHLRRDRPNGWLGALLFIATEATLFGTLIGTYFYLRFQNDHWPPPGAEHPKVALPLVLTAVLLATAVPLALAVRAARDARAGIAWLLVAAAVLIQGAYLGVQIHEFLADLDKFSPKDSAYGSIYFTLLFTHHAHVLVGILLELWLLVRLASGVTNYRFTALRITALYWYFVVALAVPVVLTQVYPSL